MKIITLDSQILNTISLCERRAKYTFIDSIAPAEKAEALERGDLIHKMLEVYESLRCNIASYDQPTWKALYESGLHPESEPPEEYALKAGRFFATKMDLGTDEVEEVFKQFSAYVEYYKDDPWETLAVEAVGSKILYENEDYQFIYSFKIDRLARKDSIIAPWDYKTSKQRKPTSPLSNQFLGYAWATDSNYMIVDKIGFQKTLSPAERFQRVILSYDSERIEEWRKNSIYWALQYAQLLEDPARAIMNLTSCDKYSGCIFRNICERAASAREWIIDRDYRRVPVWDPGKTLEVAAGTEE